MTNEQAIYQLTDLIRDRESCCRHDDFDEVFLQDIEACKMGVQALEKQVPKKLLRENSMWGICPTCERFAEIHRFVQPKHCEHCGQALDWSDNDE